VPYFLDNNLRDDDDEKGSSGVQISGASPTTESDGSVTPGHVKKDLDTGSGFQNLDKYLSTNDSQQFGQKVLGNVQGEISQAKQNQDTASDQFKNLVSNANYTPTHEQVNSAIANPTAADPGQFKTWETQNYSGPNSLADSQKTWNDYWGGTNKANTSSQLLGSEPGRFTLLDSYFGKPTYNYGQKSLDNLLIQQSGLGQQTKGLQDQAAQLRSEGNTNAGELQNLASQRAGAVNKSRNEVRSAIGIDDQNNVLTGDNAGAIGKQYAAVDASIAQANAARGDQINQVRSDLASGRLSGDELAKVGLSAGQNIYNLDLTNYLTPGAALTKEQVMTPEQQAYIQALSQLANVTDTYAQGTLADKTDPYSVDSTKLNTDIGAKGAEYNRMLQEAPVTIPSQWTLGGKGAPIPLGQLIQRVADVQNQLNKGDKVSGGQQFLNDVMPIIAKARQDLADKYQVNRVINQPYDPGASTPGRQVRPGGIL
jgi:hypothetical protein